MSPANLRLKLNTGAEIPSLMIIIFPCIANGSYAPPEQQHRVKSWILTSLQNGYRHIDTAHMYGTEKAVGEAVRESGIPREEIFITTKLPWNAGAKVRESFEESLANLGLGYIDLYLVHWPQAVVYEPDNLIPVNPDGTVKTTDKVNFNQVWAEVEKLLDTGKVKAIGVSNFSIKTLEQLFKTAKVTPAVNQVELHPYLASNELRHYCEKRGILVAAYTPSGYAIVRNDPLIVGLAEKYKVTPNHVILSWHLSRGTIVVPKSENSERQKENITIPAISEEDLGKIWHLDRGQRICNKGDEKTGQVWGWTYEQLGWESFYPKY